MTGRPVLWRIARREIAKDVARFVEVDLRMRRNRQQRPLAVEHVRARRQTRGVIELDDGRHVSFRGRIDRVISAPVARLVYDYKTGAHVHHRLRCRST